MTPEERQLILGLFERMRGFGAPEKDRDAEYLINQQVRALPDAAYMLVQSVLVQEQALENSQARIQELEERLRDLEGGEPPRRSGGFLGGYWGSRREAEPRGSVPEVGGRAPPGPPPAYEDRPWSQPPSAPPGQAPGRAGGFMRSALSTAAGVAGGMMVGDALRNMLGHGHGAAQAGSSPGSLFGGAGSTPKEETPRAEENTEETQEDPTDQDDDGGDAGDDGDSEMDV